MLHLLRIIRKDLIQVNNVKKYFLYAIGEILLIVFGILIAVQIGNWNQARKDRLEEKEVLTRISSEVAGHVTRLSNTMLGANLSQAFLGLDHVTSVFDGEPITNNIEFLNSVLSSAIFGYMTPSHQTTTYDEMVNSGKLQLIQKSELRDQVSNYYLRNQNFFDRAEALKGSYGQFTFDLIPRADESLNVVDTLGEEYAAEMVAAVLDSELRRHIVPQRNRQKFLKILWTSQVELANELLAEIDAELEGQ